MIGSHLDITCHWSLTRDTLADNYKNDIAWLITLRGIKVRDFLHTWGYIDTDLCAYCGHKETIDHCFLNCKRAKRVWTALVPTLSALLNFSFLVNIKTVFFYQWYLNGDKNHMQALFMIKTILYGLWVFRNKTTIHNCTETHRAIVKYIKSDIAIRLHVDFSRMTKQKFSVLWCHPNICEITSSKLVINV